MSDLFDPDYLAEQRMQRLVATEGFAIIMPQQSKWCMLECGRCERDTRHNLYPNTWVCTACGNERVPPTPEGLKRFADELLPGEAKGPVGGLQYRDYVPDGHPAEIEWHPVPDLATPSEVRPSDWIGPQRAADTLALCYSCGQEYRYDMAGKPGSLVCPRCGERSTYERSRRLLQGRYPGLSV